MLKNRESVSDIFVKKIIEKGQRLFTKSELSLLWTRSGGSKNRLSYAVSLLLGRDILSRVARDVYIVAGESIEGSYWDIIKKLIQIHSPSGAIVGGEKSLELHMMNYSIPDTLVLYTRNTNIRIRIMDGREVHFRTLLSGKKTHTKNLYPIIARFTSSIDALGMIVPQREIAILEACSLREHESGIVEANIIKFLSKHNTIVDGEVLLEIVKYRYIRAINRLREIAKNEGYDSLYQVTLMAIKKEGGGCFIKI